MFLLVSLGVIGIAILIWFNTPSGKKWLAEL